MVKDVTLDLVDARTDLPSDSKLASMLFKKKENLVAFPNLYIKLFQCQNYRTSRAPFDILFRSTLYGEYGRRRFLVETTDEKIYWRLDSIPISFFADYFRAPLGLIQVFFSISSFLIFNEILSKKGSSVGCGC